MKYFVFAYNYVTLHKSIVYAREKWGIENTYFIYTTLMAEPPKGLIDGGYNCKIINPLEYHYKLKIKRLSIINELVASKKAMKIAVDYIISSVSNTDEEIKLVVFRDTTLRETVLIKELRKKHKHIEVNMIEEGLAAYVKNPERPISIKIVLLGALYVLLGIPLLSLRIHQHGTNPLTKQIICSHPEKMKEENPANKEKIIQELNVFSKKNCQFFISDIMSLNIPIKEYDYVFVTQYLFPNHDEALNIKYDSFLKKILSIMAEHGNVLIKPHPFDTWDYSKYISEKVEICNEELSKCPFECLFGFYGFPQTITLYSSAAFNTATKKPTIFLYDFFPEIIQSNLFSEKFINDNNIIRCKSYEQFADIVKNI